MLSPSSGLFVAAPPPLSIITLISIIKFIIILHHHYFAHPAVEEHKLFSVHVHPFLLYNDAKGDPFG